jgi:hypothetical protein
MIIETNAAATPRTPLYRWLFAAALLVLLSAPTLLAQQTFGSIRGEVKDVQGGLVSNAQVTLTNEATKVSRTDVSNSAGLYLFGGLDPGTYKVTVAVPGFKTFESVGNIVSVGAIASVDAVMQIGGSNETVEVTSDTLTLSTASASGGQLFDAKAVEDLPLLGRNPFMLEAFDANVVLLGDPRYVRAEDQTGSSQISLAGAPSNSNTYVVDGIPISTSAGQVTFVPPIEAVESAKIQANTYDAEIGRSGGGVFNTTMKTGSSVYHGVLYGETRQTPWSANLWFDTVNPTAETATPNDTTYIYEGGIGGPLLPKWVKKPHWLDNTFFWLDEAGYRQGQPYPNASNYYVPSTAERAGDFSAYAPSNYVAGSVPSCGTTSAPVPSVAGNGAPCIIIFDPTTFPRVSYLQETGSNKVPSANVNAIGKYILNAFPGATSTSIYGQSAYNFSNPGTSFKSRDDTYSGKLSHTFFPWWTSEASYIHQAIQEPSGNSLIVPFANSNKLLRYTDVTAINNTFTINPTTLLTVAYGFNRYYSASFQYTTGFNASNGFGGAGFASSFASQLQSPTFPSITLSNINNTPGLGAANTGPTVYASHNVVVVATKVINRNNVKAGYALRLFDQYTKPTTGGNGSFTFNGQYSDSTGASPTVTGATAYADLLEGLPSAASVTVTAGSFIQQEVYHALFAQDDYRVNDKLTLNFGVRYEYELGQTEKNNRYNVGFNPNITYSYTGGTTAAPTTVNATGGLQFAGQAGAPTHCCDNSHTKFSPRVGISFTPIKDTVIHAGYGVFYAPVGLVAATTGYSQSSAYSPGNATAAAVAGPNAYLSAPFSSGGVSTILQPTGNTLGPLTGIGGSFTGSSTYVYTTGLQGYGKRYPFVQQYSVDVEHQFPYDVLFKVGYYGAHGRNFANYTNINQVPDAVLATYAPGGANAGTLSTSNNLSTKVANPYYSAVPIGGLPPTGVVAQATVAKGQLLLPFPQFTQVFQLQSSGYSNYNSLVVKAQKRMAKGLTVLGTYTWAANWDNIWSTGSQIYSFYGPQDAYNPKAEYARSNNSIPSRYTATVTYELPFGRGKRFLGSSKRWVDEIVGGWEVNDEWIIQNGVPVSIQQTDLSSGTYGTAGVGGTYQRPNIGAGGIYSACVAGRPQGRLGSAGSFGSGTNLVTINEKAYVNPAAFTPAQPYTYGNAPRNLPCREPGYDNSNISVYKEFQITERVHFQFRAEALNAFNTPEFSPPSGVLGITAASTPFTAAPTVNGYPVGGAVNQGAQTLGNITSTIGFARIIQLGGRLSF